MINTDKREFDLEKLGSSSKVIIYKENEFKEELAPDNAIIENYEVNGEKYVIMQYKL